PRWRRRAPRALAREGPLGGGAAPRPPALRARRAGGERPAPADPALPRALAARRSGGLPRRALGAVGRETTRAHSHRVDDLRSGRRGVGPAAPPPRAPASRDRPGAGRSPAARPSRARPPPPAASLRATGCAGGAARAGTS